MPTKRYMLLATALTTTYTVSIPRFKSLKVVQVSCTGNTYKEIFFLKFTGNPAAVLPALPVNLYPNAFIDSNGTTTTAITFAHRGELETTNIVASNRQDPDVIVENSTHDITALRMEILLHTGDLNINAANPVCVEIICEQYY